MKTKSVPKDIREWIRAHGEQLELFGVYIKWRRDGGFTAFPRRIVKERTSEGACPVRG